MIDDLRFAFRSLRKNPAFSALAICVLGAGIGAATAIFSVADAVLFRPLVLPNLETLITAGGKDPSSGAARRLSSITPADFYAWREATRTIDHLSMVGYQFGVNLSGDGEPERARCVRVTWEFFDALGAKPLLGRAFVKEDDDPDAPRVVVIGEGLWRRRFAGRDDVTSQSMRINGEQHRVIGVMPAHVRVPGPAELWIPLALRQEWISHGSFGFQSLGRIKPGYTLAQVNAELAAMAKDVAAKYPDTHGRLSAAARPITEELSGDSAPYVRMMLGATIFLVLLASVNVANLQFVRVSGKVKEFAVQMALGSGRWRVLRTVLVESALVGVLGALAGAAAGYWGVELIRDGMPADVEIYLPGWARMSLDWRALGYALTLGLGSGLAAGFAALFSGSLADPMSVLKDSARASSSTASRRRLRNVLVVAEAALAIVLLAGAGLMVRGFRNIALPAPGMDPEHVLTFQLDLDRKAYPDTSSWARFAERLGESLATLPGATGSAIATNVPYGGNRGFMAFQIQGRQMPLDVWSRMSHAESVTPGYFRTMHIPLQRGRGFEKRDDENAQKVAIVNEAFARKHFPNQDPIGQHIRIGRDFNSKEPWYAIVGVAADVRHYASEPEVVPLFYRPMAQAARSDFFAVIRTSGDPAALATAARATLRSIDEGQSLFAMKRYDSVMAEELTGFWYVATIMGLFGLLALVLAAVGLYAVLAYSVSERTHEIGIRMALGATRARVLGGVMKQGLAMVLAGLGIGLCGAIALGRLIGGLMFGVSENDPSTIAGAVALLLVAACAACYLPARRAADADPIEALRHD
ncbi:MAG: ABC transporter permease [Bryobacteraceae bacterium]